jgi:hypothetical protein
LKLFPGFELASLACQARTRKIEATLVAPICAPRLKKSLGFFQTAVFFFLTLFRDVVNGKNPEIILGVFL